MLFILVFETDAVNQWLRYPLYLDNPHCACGYLRNRLPTQLLSGPFASTTQVMAASDFATWLDPEHAGNTPEAASETLRILRVGPPATKPRTHEIVTLQKYRVGDELFTRAYTKGERGDDTWECCTIVCGWVDPSEFRWRPALDSALILYSKSEGEHKNSLADAWYSDSQTCVEMKIKGMWTTIHVESDEEDYGRSETDHRAEHEPEIWRSLEALLTAAGAESTQEGVTAVFNAFEVVPSAHTWMNKLFKAE